MEQQYLNAMIKSGLLQEIEAERRDAACECMGITIKRYREEQRIFEEEEAISHVGIVASGAVRSEKFYPEGDVHLVYLYQPGECFALETAASRRRTAPLTYTADREATVLFISVDEMMQSAFSSRFGMALMHLLADDNIKKLYKIETLSRRGLRDRILSHFYILQKKSGGRTFSLNMDREQFAQYLCVNRSALSSELNQMKREGIIDFQKDQFRFL